MRRFWLCLAAGFLLVSCRSRSSHAPILAPDFELKDLSGNTVTLKEFRGHPVFLDFWATWCGPCQMATPLVDKFYDTHKKEGLIVLGMNSDDDPSVVYPFVKHFQIKYPVLLAGGTAVQENYQVQGLPTFLLIDAQGRVVRYYEGFNFDMPLAWEAEFQHLKASSN